MMAEFAERRDVVVDGLNAIPGIRCHKPAGAFYVFPNIEGTGWDERSLQQALLNEAGVAALAGTAFGAHGRGYLRLSYANSVTNLEKGIERIGDLLAGHPPDRAGSAAAVVR
jgi:aspartate/methionine/tyrosine aminotransferase